jgi:Methyltransferase domain
VSGACISLPASVDLRLRVRQFGDDVDGTRSPNRGAMSRQAPAAAGTPADGDDRFPTWWYARVLRRLRPAGGRLFAFGCGTGGLLQRLSPHFEVYGYDPSALARSQCRTRVADAVILEDWRALPAASFETVVCLRALAEMPHPLQTVHTLAAALSDGGLLLLAVPNPGGLGRRLKGRRWFAAARQPRAGFLSRGEWVTLLRKAGLEVLGVAGDGLWDVPYVPLLPLALQRAVFAAPAALQAFAPLRCPVLPAAFGECLMFVARKVS